jgi:RNA polymerase sigma factor FliA
LNPADSAELSDLQRLMNGLVDALPEREQTLIRSIYFGGLSIKQAGEQIGISKAWASRLHGRILDTLGTQITGSSDVGPTSEVQENVPQHDNPAETHKLQSMNSPEKLRI